MISNLDSTLNEPVKKRLCILNHYKFYIKLISTSPKFNK